MKSLRKVISFVIALAMVFTFATAAFAADDEFDEEAFDKALEEEFNAMLNDEPELDVPSLSETLPDLADGDKVDEADVVPMEPIEKIVLVDNDDIAVAVTGYTPMSEDGPAFELTLTNKTDLNLCYSLYDVSVNNFMIDPLWAVRLDPQSEETSVVAWDPDMLAMSGINYLETIEGNLWVYDNDDYDADDILDEVVVWAIDPEDADMPACEAPEFDFDAKVLLDGNVKVTAVNCDAEEEDGPSILMLVENNSDATVMVRAENVSIDGKECNPYWFEILNPGKAIYSPCYWLTSDLEEAEVESIGTVDMKITVTDDESYKLVDANECSITFPAD